MTASIDKTLLEPRTSGCLHPALRTKRLTSTQPIGPWSLAAIALAAAVAITLRPLGLDRDYSEYWLYFHDRPARSARIDISAFGLLWQAARALEFSFGTVLAMTTFAAVLPKLVVLTRRPLAWIWLVYYGLALVPLHEYTQVRLAVGLGLMFLALDRAVRKGRSDLHTVAWAAMAAWTHPTLLLYIPWLIAWRWIGRHWGVGIVLAIAPLLVRHSTLVTAISPFHTHDLLALSTETDYQSGNPISARNLILVTVTLIGLLNIRSLPPANRPAVFILTCSLSTWYAMSQLPLIAHRVLELAMVAPLFWIPELPATARWISAMLMLCLAAGLAYLFLSDPTFFMRS